MIVSEIRLFELLKAMIGEKEAEAFVGILESRVGQKFEDAKSGLSTKEDIANLRTEMYAMKADLIKWMFIFWIGQIAVIAGLWAYFFKLHS